MNTGIEIIWIGVSRRKQNKIDLEYRGYINYFVIIIFKPKNVVLVQLLLTCRKNK